MNGATTVESEGMMTASGNDTKTYRGRTLEELIPQIKAELGPDAVITRQRDGLMGGVGGFFQRRFVEIEARPGRARFDAYDDEPARPGPMPADPAGFDDFLPDQPQDPATAEGLSSPAIQELLQQASPFAQHLSDAESAEAPEHLSQQAPLPFEQQPQPLQQPQPVQPQQPVQQAQPAYQQPAPPVQQAPEPVPAPVAPARPAVADALERRLLDGGLSPERASAVVQETVSHLLPFGTPRGMKKLVRAALARRIPVEPGFSRHGRSLAFVGPGGSGKTLCTARLAAAYAQGSDLPVICLTLTPDGHAGDLARMLEPLGVAVHAVSDPADARGRIAAAAGDALVVVDTPALAPRSAAEVRALAAQLETLGLDQVHLTLPATFSPAAARELIAACEPLGVACVTLTHTDETSHFGGLVDTIIESGRPVSFLSSGTTVPGGLEPADALDLASLVLP
jgi:flagellar biosynthesis protein FlhF